MTSNRSRSEILLKNVALAGSLCERGESPEVIATVSGSSAAQRFWQSALETMRDSFSTREAVSLVEDLPVNQAFGVLLCGHRLRASCREGRGALAAFVFGEGTRSAPWTEAECGQKPALLTFARVPGSGRLRSMVELAMLHFVPVQQFLRRSGFDGLVVKWGDEVQIPARDLSGSEARFDGADVVRFVSMQRMTEHLASQKDWVGVDHDGRVTAFLPRRPLAEMERLADRGLLQRDGASLVGGVNLGSIALSWDLLDALWEEFGAEVLDASADRQQRPDLDPQFFTALTIAAMDDPARREASWRAALEESAHLRAMDRDLPRVLQRLRRVFDRFEHRHGRAVKLVAMDCGEPYWGDAGQHGQLAEFFAALRASDETGMVARALAGLPEQPDEQGNRLLGHCALGEGVSVRNSVLVDVHLKSGAVENCVLIGTRAHHLQARDSFDVGSRVRSLRLESAGAYRVHAHESLHSGPGERLTTVFDRSRAEHYRVHESTDLRRRDQCYDVPILGNPRAFADLHRAVLASDPRAVAAARLAFEAEFDR